MQKYLAKTHLRYLLAIVMTAGLMIWQSTDAVRAGAELFSQALFWSVSVTVGWLQMIVVSRGVRATLGANRFPGWKLLVVSAFAGALPLAFEVRWLMQTIVAPQAGLPAPWVTYLNVTLICAVFSLVQYLLIERWPFFEASSQPDGNPPTTPPTQPVSNTTTADATPVDEDHMPPDINLLSRQPDGLVGNICYMQMEDHYLRVHTDAGNGMVLHRMSDAVNELSRTNGLQVHKSWWVARDAVQEIRRNNRARSIVTWDGTKIPIGRSFEKSVRAAGWF